MDSTARSLVPPFSKENMLQPITHLNLPHRVRDPVELLEQREKTQEYLREELRTAKLDRLYPYLWLAGLPRPARPLHRQKLLRRTIYLTEAPDEHLVWHDAHISIKPAPECLFDFNFWQQHLCSDDALHKSACGMLLSYSWLVCHKSDLHVACEMGLLPTTISWEAWNRFIIDVCSHVDTRALRQVDRRYRYGELRLSRLNSLYHFSAAGFSLHNMMYGFMSGSTRYTTFFERNFGWILAVFAYVSIILSAMQVALATERFSNNTGFQHFSHGIALFSIAFVLLAVSIVLAVWFALFWFHLLSTITYFKKVAVKRQEKSYPE